MKYKGYCANIARTYIVDPSRNQESIYALLEELHKEVVAKLKDGAVARDVYNHALLVVKQKKPELEGHFLKNLGHAVSVPSRLIASSHGLCLDGSGIQRTSIRAFPEECQSYTIQYGF